jgi:simple sugar transport system permease protein
MVVMLQGFIVLFSGAMAYVLAPTVAWAIGLLRGAAPDAKGAAHG